MALLSIADSAEGRAAPDADAHAHLSACSACAGNLAWAARVIGVMRADAGEEPSDRAAPAFGAGEAARRIVETSSRIDAPVPRRLNAAAVGL